MLPNFFVIGAKKAGTTSLYHYLAEHPEVFVSEIKETNFFMYDEGDAEMRRRKGTNYRVTTWGDYEALYGGSGEASAVGDISPGYLHSERACRRIREFRNDSRIIAILRNPIERTYSGYVMAVRDGREKRSFDQAFGSDQDWVTNSFYSKALEMYLDRFGPECVGVFLYDDLKADTIEFCRSVYRFLGVNDSFVPRFDRVHNPGGVPRNRLLHSLYRKGRRIGVLRELFPSGARQTVARFMNSNLQDAAPLDEVQKNRLGEFFAPEIDALEALLGRDLGCWR